MPRYDYRCTACSLTFEVEHGMREKPQIFCPSCGAPATRQLNTSGIVFKGSGFYNTDMRGGKAATEATGSGKSSGGSEGAKDTGSASSSTDGAATGSSSAAEKPAAAAAPASSPAAK
jgi:putative FmdB family regulatory protein